MYKVTVSGVKVRVHSISLSDDMLVRLSLIDDLTPETLNDLFIDFSDVFKQYDNITEGYDVRYPFKISIENVYNNIDYEIYCGFVYNDILDGEIYYTDDKNSHLIYEKVIKNTLTEYIINTNDRVILSDLKHTIDTVKSNEDYWFCRNNIYYKGNSLTPSFFKESSNEEYRIFFKK